MTERERVLGLLDGITPGQWSYCPWRFDDWGMVRAEDGHIVALARDGGAMDADSKSAHRANGTDPYEANARLIAAAPDTARRYAEALAEIERLREALKEAQTRANQSIAHERVREDCERKAADATHGGPVRALYKWTADYHKANARSFEWIAEPIRAALASSMSQAAK